MPAADAGAAADYWLLVAPVAGTVVNIFAQLILARVMSGQRLLLLIVIAFAIGLAVTATVAFWALRLGEVALFDGIALGTSVLLIYGAAGLVMFALINLGETSLRIRMMKLLREAREDITREQLIADYDDAALVAVRLKRLEDKAQARVVADVFFPRRSLLFMASAMVRLMKRIVYGRRHLAANVE
jgi:hypothetical protein